MLLHMRTGWDRTHLAANRFAIQIEWHQVALIFANTNVHFGALFFPCQVENDFGGRTPKTKNALHVSWDAAKDDKPVVMHAMTDHLLLYTIMYARVSICIPCCQR